MCKDFSVQFFIRITIPDMTEFFPDKINPPYGIYYVLCYCTAKCAYYICITAPDTAEYDKVCVITVSGTVQIICLQLYAMHVADIDS